MGGAIKAIENELTAVDDRTFRRSLKRAYPKMLLALGKLVPPCCFVMPMRFLRGEWVPGATAVFEKFKRLCGPAGTCILACRHSPKGKVVLRVA
jgi:peptide/nickel transport system substrate-binding protein